MSDSAAPERPGVDKRLIGIVGAGLVAVALILVIVFTSIRPIPDFADLAASGETGYVAYVRDGGGDPSAVVIVDLGAGTSVEVDAIREGEIVGWDDDGSLVIVEWGPNAERFYLVDPATGEEVGTLGADEGQRYFEEDPVWIDHRDGRIVLERDRDGLTASFEAPDSYDVSSASAMGTERIVFVDELGRLAVVGPGEDVTPVEVADDALEWWRVAGRDQ